MTEKQTVLSSDASSLNQPLLPNAGRIYRRQMHSKGCGQPEIASLVWEPRVTGGE